MPFRPPAKQPTLDTLLAQLNVSGIKESDNPLYQVIVQLIKAVKQLQGVINGEITAINNSISNIVINNESEGNILQLLSRRNSIPSQKVIMIGSGDSECDCEFVEWSVLTNGDPMAPEIVFDSFGDVIMVHIP